MGRALGRLILVPLGILLGAAAALAVLVSLGLERVTHATHGRGGDPGLIFDGIRLARGAFAMLDALALVPALLVIVVGEVARIRSSLYYILGGGIALAVLPLIVNGGAVASIAGLGPKLWQVLATAGFAGGLVYWLIAGRRA